MTYYEDPGPGYGVLPPRAAFRSDAPSICLNGTWRFHFAESVESAVDGFEREDFDDSAWSTIPVPSSWPMHGFGRPVYTNQPYPFPVDPPYVPSENPTGDHRLEFEVPLAWTGPLALRFDGVDSCARVWLNGVELGVTRGSRLPSEFDVSALVRPGRNVLAVRVHQWSSGSYLEDQDMWWLPGIFRDVTLIARPAGGVADIFVHADYDHVTGAGTLLVEAPGASVCIAELGLEVPAGERVTIPAVEPWSAEVPRLYDAQVVAGGETVQVRIGFRTVAIVDGVLTVNGRRVLFHGVNRHEHDPVLGRVVPLERLRRELLVMKQHNINAIRTSHYPPDSRLLELCDELGFWVMDECDYETHGFFLLDWRGNPADDPRFEEASLDRMRRLVEGDKNHPSVIMWSLGNEAGVGRNLSAMAAWTRDRDPSRPVHYEGDLSCADVDVYSRMYASHAEVEAIGKRAEKPLDDPALDARRRAMPFVLCEYSHAGGNGPGGLPEYEQLFHRYERCQGGFLWEWMEHGILRPDGTYAYGGDFGEELHDGTYVLDGLVFPDLTPQPVLLEVRKAFSPLHLSVSAGVLHVGNRYDVLDTAHLSLHWDLADEGELIAQGSLEMPVIPAGGEATLELPTFTTPRQNRERWLTIRAVLTSDTPWATAGHEISFTQVQLKPAEACGTTTGAAPPPATGAAAGDAPRTATETVPTVAPQTGRAAEIAAGSAPTLTPQWTTDVAEGAAPQTGTDVAPGAAPQTGTDVAAGATSRTGADVSAGATSRTGTDVAAGAASQTGTDVAPGAAARMAREVAPDVVPVAGSGDGLISPAFSSRPAGAVWAERLGGGELRLGLGRFCRRTGRLIGVGAWDVEHVPLELWRAPTQHDARTWDASTLDRKSRWANAGLHRLRYRTISVDVDGDALVVVTMVGAAATDARVLTTYRWTSDGVRLAADVEVEPVGQWTVPWARVGVTLGLPAGFRQVTWFGMGPGQAYPDSRAAARVGRYTSTIDDLQVPYLYPQENGARADVRWAELSGTAGNLRLSGEPHLALTVRRWTTADLAAAGHLEDLVPGDRVWVTLDALQHGLGSPTSGAPILPPYDLQPQTHRFRFSVS